jgi:hypothetical protein
VLDVFSRVWKSYRRRRVVYYRPIVSCESYVAVVVVTSWYFGRIGVFHNNKQLELR